MSGPTDPIGPSRSPEDSFLEILAETLESLDRPARDQFLQRFFRTIAHIDLSEGECAELWDQILQRRTQQGDGSTTRVSLRRATFDVLATSRHLRVPVLIEYEELKKLQINAATDSLTGLYNRRFFEEQCDKELNRALRYSQNLAVVLMDLHEFKEVNDGYGHPRGDALLRVAAATLRKSLRTSDYAFRIGGDEFALLLVQADAEQALTLARRVRTNFATAITPMEMAIPTGIDYGVAFYPNDGDQKEVLIRVADERLYEMKRSQRDAHHRRDTTTQPPVVDARLPPTIPPTVTAVAATQTVG
jgi:diguanylate cyclase (GGDEF)-like protein